MSTSTGISVSSIERELENIWREEAAATTEDAAVTRARVLTLLVYSESGSSSVDDTLFEVTEMHPARALVMTVDAGASGSSLEATVSAACRVQGPRSKQVCCEQVNFEARGAAVDDLPSAVAQLLAPDVPVFLWWRAAPDVDSYAFQHLIQQANRVIIDSSDSKRPRRDMAHLAEALRVHADWAAITDFTWQRLTPWREMLASFYDMADHRPYLDRVDTVTIEYSPDEGQNDISPRALLLGAWLVERLKWELDAGGASREGGTDVFAFRAGDRPVSVRFVPVVRVEMEGLLASLTLGVTADPTASFTVTRADRHRLASEIVIEGRVHASRVLSYSPKGEAELLAGELGILGRDRLYEAAVAVAAKLSSV